MWYPSPEEELPGRDSLGKSSDLLEKVGSDHWIAEQFAGLAGLELVWGCQTSNKQLNYSRI